MPRSKSVREQDQRAGGETDLRGSGWVTLPRAQDARYVERWVERCLERIGDDDPDEEQLFRDLFEDETQREVLIDSLKADCEVRTGQLAGLYDRFPGVTSRGSK